MPRLLKKICNDKFGRKINGNVNNLSETKNVLSLHHNREILDWPREAEAPDPEIYRMLFISSFSAVRLTLVLKMFVEPHLILIHSFPKSFDGFCVSMGF